MSAPAVVSWYLIEDALDSGPKSNGFPDINPCDGSLSFPDLGEYSNSSLSNVYSNEVLLNDTL
jgi:hypothetical protein